MPSTWSRAVASSVAMARWPSSFRAAAAAPKARRAGTASRPARRPRSCSPPTRSGSKRLPRRTIIAPAPGTPPNLCALTLTRSASSAARSIGTCPHAAAASTCTVTSISWHRATTSCTGWRLPTSWLAHWQCTSAGRGRVGSPRRARKASTIRRPAPSTAIDSVGAARAEASRTAECSTSAQSTGAPGWARVAPQTAALIDSVAPEVKTTWRGATPSRSATCWRASSRRSRTTRASS